MGETNNFSSPEYWFKKQASIQEIVSYRNQLIYSKFNTNIKNAPNLEDSQSHSIDNKKFLKNMALVSMASRSLDIDFKLKRLPTLRQIKEPSVPIIGNPAPLEDIKIQENPKIHTKIDYVVNDSKLKASEAIKILYRNNIEISHITKILSAGLIGLRINRKLVPTRWSITATDDTISKNMLTTIKDFQDLNDILLFHGEYVGNHYEILLLPNKFEFEVIEISSSTRGIWKDYESFQGRKNYADSVTGAYYVNRLALSEYLLKIKKQCSCIFFREVKPEYNAPLGVGILRELSRSCFQKTPESFQTIQEALNKMQERITIPISNYTFNSKILKDYGKQKRLNQWL